MFFLRLFCFLILFISENAIAQNNLGHYYLYRSDDNSENLDQAIYYLNAAAAQGQVNAMTTVSAVVFLYSSKTSLASIAVLNMDDAGDIAPAAAMGMMIFYTNIFARIIHLALSKGVLKRTQAWRSNT